MPDDDEIIKKIREASERYHPAYDDTSWADMQRLLDEHLPQKKNKRRIVFLILLALIPLVGLYVGFKFKNPPTVPSSATTASKASILKVPEVNQLKPSAAENKTNTAQIHGNSSIKNNQNGVNKITGTAASYISNPSFNQHTPLVKNQGKNTDITIAENLPVNPGREKTLDETNAADNNNRLSPDTNTEISNAGGNDSLQSIAHSNFATKISKQDTSKNKVTARAIKKENNHFKHYWVISAGIGPDVSSVKLDNTGKITLQYGIELGYAISRRLTLRSGFFVSKKLYTAGPNDYHSQGSYNNYLQSIDANCKVYEIPLLASYNFARTKKGGWFASAGVSSYFMKRESYDYFYKYPGGTTYTNNYTVSNKNKHYFSIIDISTGYERTINKRVSISAEPYMKLPVTGIGVGKIKLNSAGVLFSVNVKPFR